jgi:hypothetical protein
LVARWLPMIGRGFPQFLELIVHNPLFLVRTDEPGYHTHIARG